MEVYEAIQSRRSIRKYKKTPIDEATLNKVLEAGRLAPSWDNTQCWRFIVVRDDQIKAGLSDALPIDNPASNAIKNAPVVIVACAKLGESGYLDGKLSSDKGDWYMFDVALAMQNMILEAQSLGLGTVYVGWFDERRVTGILEIPEDHCVLAMTPLGYPTYHPKPMPRKNLSEIISYDIFGEKR
jgi:nitroreductase